ncbi:hypothetical protein [Natronorarus salvus]|uniref:hypothetical protein n=1 Tax=Natronorarus salvus TaxID=3117733 RepID=UPI002F26B0A4
MVVGSVLAFVVALLVGGLAIYLSARVIADVEDYSHAVITALIGAIAWAVTAWIPLLGPVIALVVWIAVINWRYPGGWVDSVIIGFVAWLSALVIVFALATVLNISVGAFGVPGI